MLYTTDAVTTHSIVVNKQSRFQIFFILLIAQRYELWMRTMLGDEVANPVRLARFGPSLTRILDAQRVRVGRRRVPSIVFDRAV